MKKKMFILMLISVMMLVSLAACSNNSNKGTGNTNGTASSTNSEGNTTGGTDLPQHTFTYLSSSHPSWPYDENWIVWKYLKEETGVTLDVQIPSGTMDDALNLSVASGNMPDLLFTEDKSLGDRFGQQGALANFLDYVDEDMPNLANWMKEYPAITKNSLSADGKMYVLPVEGIGLSNRMLYLYRQDIFEENNLSAPQTWDELYTVSKKLKELYPDTTPFVFRNGLEKIQNIAPAFSTGADYYYDYDKKEWRYGPVEDNYKKIVEYLKKFVAEGLIPPDFLSIDTKQWQDIMSTDRAFVTLDYIGRIDFFNGPLRKENPDFHLAFMAPPAGWEGAPQVNQYRQYVIGGIMVSSTSKQVNDVMQYLDFLYTDKSKELMSWGKEGVDYKVNADGSKSFIGDYADVSDLRKRTGLSTNGTYGGFDYDAHISLGSPEQQEAYSEAAKYDTDEQPRPAFTAEETDILSTTGQEIAKFRDENIAKFVLGNKDMSEWDQYVTSLNKLGVEKIIEIYKTAYDRMSAAE